MDKSDLIFFTRFLAFWIPAVVSMIIYWRYKLRDPRTFKWRSASEPKIGNAYLGVIICFFLSLAALFFLPWK
jgi:hypothetical protein